MHTGRELADWGTLAATYLDREYPMMNLIARPSGPDFDWTSLAYIALLVLGGLSSIIAKVFGKKDDTIDAEIDDDTPAAPPQPQRPVARAPQPARRVATPPVAPPRPVAPTAHARPQAPVPRPAPHRTVIVQPQVPPAARRAQPQRAPRQTVPGTVVDALAATMRAVPDAVESPVAVQPAMQLDMDARSLRKAIVLSEILAPPVALRGPNDWPCASSA